MLQMVPVLCLLYPVHVGTQSLNHVVYQNIRPCPALRIITFITSSVAQVTAFTVVNIVVAERGCFFCSYC